MLLDAVDGDEGSHRLGAEIRIARAGESQQRRSRAWLAPVPKRAGCDHLSLGERMVERPQEQRDVVSSLRWCDLLTALCAGTTRRVVRCIALPAVVREQDPAPCPPAL